MLDRTVAPAFVQSTSFDLIHPDKKSLSNGIDLFLIRGGSQDVLRIDMVFKAGRWFEEVWGSAYFASHLLSKGTKSKSSFEIAELFDRYGSHLEISAGLDFITISLYSLSKNLHPVLLLLKEILQEPTFPEKEIEQAKDIYQQNLKVNLEKTSFLASKFFRKSIFGEDHPYGKELDEKDILGIGKKDLEDHYKTFFPHPSVFVSGKIESANEKHIINVFSAWETNAVPDKKVTMPSLKSFHEHIEKADSVQSSLRIGNRSLQRSHPDYVNAVFVSHILGGYFGSRLMKNIREEKGLTYGIYASLHPLKNDGYLVIGADVNKENVAVTFEEIRKELQRLRSEKISGNELDTARNHFIGGLQSEITTPFAHADKLKTIYLFGLAPTYYQQMIKTVEKIDASLIAETSEKYFNEKDFFELAVG